MDEFPIQQVDRLLKTWSQNICEQTKEIITNALGKYPDSINGGNGALSILDDVKDRQSRVISVRITNLNFLILNNLDLNHIYSS